MVLSLLSQLFLELVDHDLEPLLFLLLLAAVQLVVILDILFQLKAARYSIILPAYVYVNGITSITYAFDSRHFTLVFFNWSDDVIGSERPEGHEQVHCDILPHLVWVEQLGVGEYS